MKTLPHDVLDERAARRARAGRRAFLAAIALLVALGASGLLGVRTAQVSSEAEGYALVVTYASVTRAGLATPWSVEISNPSGLPDSLSIETTSSFLDAFDENGLDPEPVSSSSDGEWLRWTFEPPEGTTFEVSFDARVEPAVQWTRRGTTRLLVDGVVITEISFTMRVMP